MLTRRVNSWHNIPSPTQKIMRDYFKNSLSRPLMREHQLTPINNIFVPNVTHVLRLSMFYPHKFGNNLTQCLQVIKVKIFVDSATWHPKTNTKPSSKADLNLQFPRAYPHIMLTRNSTDGRTNPHMHRQVCFYIPFPVDRSVGD